MTDKPLVIVSSARKESDTKAFLHTVLSADEYDLIDLLDAHISPYSYTGEYPVNDDFMALIDELLLHRVIIFATPVYWYSMSGGMKVFIDRFTDLVTIRKDIGRQLAGKTCFLLAAGADPELPRGFEVPFQLTAEYLKMSYEGFLYHSTKFPGAEESRLESTRQFREKMH